MFGPLSDTIRIHYQQCKEMLCMHDTHALSRMDYCDQKCQKAFYEFHSFVKLSITAITLTAAVKLNAGRTSSQCNG